MTRRALTKQEEEQIPVYLNSPYIKDDLCYAWWEDQLVWSDLDGAPWYWDENNEEIQDQDFEKRFPGYKNLTGVQVDKETFTAKYKGVLRHGRDVHPTWVKSSIETLSNTRVWGSEYKGKVRRGL